MALKHAFVSPVADGVDPALVLPSDWNGAHIGFPALATFEARLGGGRIVTDFGARSSGPLSWGTAIAGGTWLGGPFDSVSGGEGTTFSDTAVQARLDVSNFNPEMLVDIKSSGMPSNSLQVLVFLRDTPSPTAFVKISFTIASSGVVTLGLGWQYGGDAAGAGVSPSVPFVWVANTYHTIRASLVESIASVKIWRSSDSEPTEWTWSRDMSNLQATHGVLFDSIPRVGSRVEVDLSSFPDLIVWTLRNLSVRDAFAQFSGTFDVTGLSGLTVGKQVFVFQVPGPYTDKGTREDEAEVALVTATGYVVDATTIRVYWRSDEPIAGSVKFAYAVAA